MRELSPDDKYQRRNRGELMHPGCCLSCRAGNSDDGYVDLNTYFDYEGQMYLCQACVVEIGQIFGMMPSDESKFLQTRNEEMALLVESLKEQLTNANRRLRAYDDVLSPVRTDLDARVTSYNDADETGPTLFDSNDESDVRVTGRSVNGESESKEPVTSGSGPTGLALAERGDKGAGPSTGLSI
jgi:hypothetical protein